MQRPLLAVLCLVSVAARAETFAVKTDASTVTYHIHAAGALHKVAAPSHQPEGRVQLDGGHAQVSVRVPIASFDSGNPKRDAKMKDVTEATKFPFVEVKTAGDGINLPASFPFLLTKTMKLEVTFHGVSQTVDAPVTITFEAANKIVAKTSFTVSLDSFKVERPTMVFFKVGDDLRIDADVTFTR